MEHVEAVDPGARLGGSGFVVRAGGTFDRADREEIGENDLAGHWHRRERNGGKLDVSENFEVILSSRTAEVTSFYTLEFEDSSILCRLGAHWMRKGAPPLVNPAFHFPMRVVDGIPTEQTMVVGQVMRTRRQRIWWLGKKKVREIRGSALAAITSSSVSRCATNPFSYKFRGPPVRSI